MPTNRFRIIQVHWRAGQGTEIGLIENYFDDLIVRDVRAALEDALEQLEELGAKSGRSRFRTWIRSRRYGRRYAVRKCFAHLPYLKTRPRDYSPGLLSQIVSSM